MRFGPVRASRRKDDVAYDDPLTRRLAARPKSPKQQAYERRNPRLKCNLCGGWMCHRPTPRTPLQRALPPHAGHCTGCLPAAIDLAWKKRIGDVTEDEGYTPPQA